MHDHALLEAIASLTSEHIIVIDLERRILHVSDHTMKRWRLDRQNMSWDMLLAQLPAPLAAALGEGVTAAGQSRRLILREVVMPSGDGQVFECGVAPAWSADGQLAALVCRVCDVTAKRRSEEQSRRLQREMTHEHRILLANELASGIAHELNQPLGAITNLATTCQRLLTDYDGVPAEVMSALQNISDEAGRAAQIIRRLRSLMQKRPVVEQVIRVPDLIHSVCDLLQAEMRAHRILIEVTDDAVGEIFGDGVLLKQALINIVRNAVEAIAEADSAMRVVKVDARRDDLNDSVVITVSDSGPGVSPQLREKVFEPFSTTKRDGLGMGLHICRSAVEAHGGTLTYESGCDGGAVFRMSLPGGAGSIQ